ncbi:hypothetical protein TREMEDRAFT_59535 [Tremella mesenterica DSM 1558]|uniref:uncharacterized protein n=1 Tax=Tremella mesenterica (strain ATCC 24925 / CBS 8224 / DSM 1558 / NBRC 9311 / NRRL Y-6157 / RJB 2259-6 / UBC 559-6) TaxID=578456 RepID=UPI0003F49762|nr:uncharacterized protein TREMEDRAFT_59535 [Tremella mesenterica DSM 1558]EIW73370.1 hypothetical protein TREMEDRAFT_59535 [Tremella mesenterica DSM 1558]
MSRSNCCVTVFDRSGPRIVKDPTISTDPRISQIKGKEQINVSLCPNTTPNYLHVAEAKGIRQVEKIYDDHLPGEDAEAGNEDEDEEDDEVAVRRGRKRGKIRMVHHACPGYCAIKENYSEMDHEVVEAREKNSYRHQRVVCGMWYAIAGRQEQYRDQTGGDMKDENGCLEALNKSKLFRQ